MNGESYVIAARDGSFDVLALMLNAERFMCGIQITVFEGTTGELLMRDFYSNGITDISVPGNVFWNLQMITFYSGSSGMCSQSASAAGQRTSSVYVSMDRMGWMLSRSLCPIAQRKLCLLSLRCFLYR